MIALESVMLVALGVFAAGACGLFLAPLYRRRAARLAIQDLKRSMPLTEAEIRADKDRLRAENAIAIHRLERRLEEGGLVAARQRVEINRRDASISGLEGEVVRLGTILDEHENARRVLEQTITERLPMVERRLTEAKQLLSQRDKEIAALSRTADKNATALEEATQINARQREEMHRLNATLATRQASNRSSFRDAGVETEIALRGEIESLRTMNRDQSELIERLKAGRKTTDVRASSNSDADLSPKAVADIEKLRENLAEAQQALKQAQGETAKGKESQSGLESELAAVKTEADRLRSEILRLKAALNVYETSDKEQRATKETKVALKARVGALESEISEQAETIRRLKAEIAQGNDKLARQAAHYVEVIRRLGGGTRPTTGPASAGAMTGAGHSVSRSAARRADPLLERLNAPRKDGRVLLRQSRAGSTADPRATRSELNDGKVSDFIKALGGVSTTPAASSAAQVTGDNGARSEKSPNASGSTEAGGTGASQQAGPKARRPGLLERLAGTTKPSA